MNKRRKYGLLLAAAIALMAAAVYLAGRAAINEYTLKQFEKEHYSERPEEFLILFNLPEGYVPYYNLGNEAYKMGNYDRAISYYRKALASDPPEGKECPIRVNLALAMIEKIDFDHLDEPQARKNAITLLKSARQVLCEVGCADPDGTDGHDEQAEKLKQEIDELLKELEQDSNQNDEENETESEPQQETQQETQESKKDNKQTSKREQEVEKQIRKNQEQASSERNKTQKNMENQGRTDNSGGNQEAEGSGGVDDANRKFW